MADQTFPTAGAAQQLTYKHYAAWLASHVSGLMIYFTGQERHLFTALIGDASKKRKKKKKKGAYIRECAFGTLDPEMLISAVDLSSPTRG